MEKLEKKYQAQAESRPDPGSEEVEEYEKICVL
jgi:hypothetical protein